MEVKGTAVKSIPEFVRAKHPERYNEWIQSLPEGPKKIMAGAIITSNWYPLKDGLSIPVGSVGQMFYGSPTKGAWIMGRYSAETALTGIYKLYVQIGSAKHIIERANRVFAAYFQPSEIVSADSTKTSFVFRITKFDQIDEVVEHNIAGWMERALEISGCKNVQVTIPKSLSKGFPYSEFYLKWE